MKHALVGAVAAAAFCAGPALSDGWNIRDLGSSASIQSCMDKAFATFDWFQREAGRDIEIGRSDWTVAAYDMRGPDIDAIIMCPEEAGLIAPFLIVHSTGDDNDARRIIFEQLKDLWERAIP